VELMPGGGGVWTAPRVLRALGIKRRKGWVEVSMEVWEEWGKRGGVGKCRK